MCVVLNESVGVSIDYTVEAIIKHSGKCGQEVGTFLTKTLILSPSALHIPLLFTPSPSSRPPRLIPIITPIWCGNLKIP